MKMLLLTGDICAITLVGFNANYLKMLAFFAFSFIIK
jgi:hypothetical protein